MQRCAVVLFGPATSWQGVGMPPPHPRTRLVVLVPARYRGGTGMLLSQDYLAAPANLALELGMAATVVSAPAVLPGVAFDGPRTLDARVAVVSCGSFRALARLLWRSRDAVVYANFRTRASWLAALLARRTILVAHGPLPRARVKRLALAVALRRFAAVRALTPDEHDGLRALGLGRRAVLLPLAVDWRFFGEAPEAGRLVALRRRVGDGPIVLLVANVRRVKRVDTVLRAVARLARAGRALRLVVAGEDLLPAEGLPSVEALAASLGIAEHVVATGFVPPGTVRELLHLADVFVNGSSAEAQCLAACEAAAAGRPLCLADLPSLRATFPEARFHAPGDDRALAANLAAVLDGDVDPAALEAAKRRVADRADPERVREALAGLLLRVAGERAQGDDQDGGRGAAGPRRGSWPPASAVSLRDASTE